MSEPGRAHFPGLRHIWMIEDPLSSRSFRAAYEIGDDRLFTLTGYNLAPPPSHMTRLRHGMGGAVPQDVVWPRSVMPPFVSDRVINLLQEFDITGWGSFPIEIRDKSGKIHTNYFRLVINATPCGAIDWRRGGPLEQTGVPSGQIYRGGWFDAATWDGSDIFRSVHGGWILVVERVQDLFASARISNVKFTRITEFEMPEIILASLQDK